MIARIYGKVITIKPPLVILDIQGLGYEIEMPLNDCIEIKQEEMVVVYTYLITRQEQQVLYGFLQESSKNLFKQLLKISGIGPKSALAILSKIPLNDFYQCIALEDIKTLSTLPGIGKKTAERIIIEMRGLQPETPVVNMAFSDALQALIALGYKACDAENMLKKAPAGLETTEALLRAALKK